MCITYANCISCFYWLSLPNLIFILIIVFLFGYLIQWKQTNPSASRACVHLKIAISIYFLQKLQRNSLSHSLKKEKKVKDKPFGDQTDLWMGQAWLAVWTEKDFEIKKYGAKNGFDAVYGELCHWFKNSPYIYIKFSSAFQIEQLICRFSVDNWSHDDHFNQSRRNCHNIRSMEALVLKNFMGIAQLFSLLFCWYNEITPRNEMSKLTVDHMVMFTLYHTH